MTFDISKPSQFEPVKQLSVYCENKVGRLNELIGILGANKIHIMALTSVDSTHSSLIRMVVDYTDHACALLEENAFAFNSVEVIAVEIDSEAKIKTVTCALVEAEINIHYIYPFLMRPHGHSGLVLCVEDNDLGMEVLKQHQIKVLSQTDIAR